MEEHATHFPRRLKNQRNVQQMAQIKHENDKYQVRITVAVSERGRDTHRVAYACIHFNIFFFMVITHKENNLNLYSTPTFFLHFFLFSLATAEERKIKNYSIDYCWILKCSFFIHSLHSQLLMR